ncbi:uncharacterized protein [Enterobacter phage ATCEA85]|nr:uncharacterized protein [Enterobacter phage ATCEA85]
MNMYSFCDFRDGRRQASAVRKCTSKRKPLNTLTYFGSRAFRPSFFRVFKPLIHKQIFRKSDGNGFIYKTSFITDNRLPSRTGEKKKALRCICAFLFFPLTYEGKMNS